MERHTIALPLLVTPVAPAGEQNAPACTTLPAGRVVEGAGFGVVGFGLGVGGFEVGAVVVLLGLTVVRIGRGLVGTGLLVVGTAATCCRAGATTAADDAGAGAGDVATSGLALPGPKTVTSVAPPQHNTASASNDTSTTGNGRTTRRFPPAWSGCGATGSNHGSCGVGGVTVTPCGRVLTTVDRPTGQPDMDLPATRNLPPAFRPPSLS